MTARKSYTNMTLDEINAEETKLNAAKQAIKRAEAEEKQRQIADAQAALEAAKQAFFAADQHLTEISEDANAPEPIKVKQAVVAIAPEPVDITPKVVALDEPDDDAEIDEITPTLVEAEVVEDGDEDEDANKDKTLNKGLIVLVVFAVVLLALVLSHVNPLSSALFGLGAGFLAYVIVTAVSNRFQSPRTES